MSEDYIKFTVNLPRDLHKQAKIKAAQTDTTLADIIRSCLEEFVNSPVEGGVEEEERNGKN